MIYIGLDDTDVLESCGTGHLAHEIARVLKSDYDVLGVTRHQLLVDSRVPCTKNNSCSAIHLNGDGSLDPGLCIATTLPPAITDYGRRAQRELVTQAEARALAAQHGITLVGLGGDEDGVIGALSAVWLAASGSDGRYVLVGRSAYKPSAKPVSLPTWQKKDSSTNTVQTRML